jgi:hypothetical protein
MIERVMFDDSNVALFFSARLGVRLSATEI